MGTTRFWCNTGHLIWLPCEVFGLHILVGYRSGIARNSILEIPGSQEHRFGSYAIRQNLPSELKGEFSSLLADGLSEMDPIERDKTYKKINGVFYDQVPCLIIASQTSHTFEQRWAVGRINNPLFQGNYFYPMYKQ